MITKKEPFNEDLLEQRQQAFTERRIKYLERQLSELKQVA